MVGSPMTRRQAWAARVGIFVATVLTVELAAVSFAVADPEGWAAWRVALVTWPAGVIFGVILATFPFTYVDDD